MEDRPGGAKGNLVAIAKRPLTSHALPIYEGPIETTEVLQDELRSRLNDDAVLLRHDLVEQLHAVIGMTPQRIVRGQSYSLLSFGGGEHKPRHGGCRLLFTLPNDKYAAICYALLAMPSAILAIDQGTTGTTALVLSSDGRVLSRHNVEFQQYFPKAGWVEHDVEDIWRSVQEAVSGAVLAANIEPGTIAAVGLTNQRETVVSWERSTGKAIGRAIVWQDRRTAQVCQELRSAGHEPRARALSGLVLDPYFAATKMRWILDHRIRGGVHADICLGTVDTFLLWRLTGGHLDSRAGSERYATDATNASRTLLMDLERQAWSPELCELFGVPLEVLPEIVPCAGALGATRGFAPLLDGTPIAAMAGDQHAALFGQACFAPGDIKCTYGTGAFVVMNTGQARVRSQAGLIETLAWQIPGETTFALEGSCFIAGAAVQWLRDGLGLIASASESETLARRVESSEGVVFVPALSGLGAPHWDPAARGLIAGITRGTTRAHLARAALEGVAFQVDDLIQAMRRDTSRGVTRLRVDGGAAGNDLLMQIQADISGLKVERPVDLESTARGAAMLAGLGVGLYSSPQQAAQMIQTDRTFDVIINEHQRNSERRRWVEAVARARSRGSDAQVESE